MADTKFCLCCGEEVPFNRIHREGTTELTCVYCGFVLDIKPQTPAAALECIIAADDAPFVRDLLKGMMVKKKMAETVLTSENGQEFIAALNKRLLEKEPVDMVILDLEMPVMDGITAARIMRSLEGKYQADRIPILFFSARKCDEALKQKLSEFAPAHYINKGTSNDPVQLLERVDRMIAHLLEKLRGPGAAPAE